MLKKLKLNRSGESFAADLTSRIATGVSTTPANHIPQKGLITSAVANDSPVLIKTKYIIKSNAAMTTGAPKPPLLTMAPNDAPMKNNTIMAYESANFLWNSIQ